MGSGGLTVVFVFVGLGVMAVTTCGMQMLAGSVWPTQTETSKVHAPSFTPSRSHGSPSLQATSTPRVAVTPPHAM
jgi:hypothetical protein